VTVFEEGKKRAAQAQGDRGRRTNARRLLKAYENALNGIHIPEHGLLDPNAADAR
jgi:hypothetical protein